MKRTINLQVFLVAKRCFSCETNKGATAGIKRTDLDAKRETLQTC